MQPPWAPLGGVDAPQGTSQQIRSPEPLDGSEDITGIPLDALLLEGDNATWNPDDWMWDPYQAFAEPKDRPNCRNCQALSGFNGLSKRRRTAHQAVPGGDPAAGLLQPHDPQQHACPAHMHELHAAGPQQHMMFAPGAQQLPPLFNSAGLAAAAAGNPFYNPGAFPSLAFPAFLAGGPQQGLLQQQPPPAGLQPPVPNAQYPTPSIAFSTPGADPLQLLPSATGAPAECSSRPYHALRTAPRLTPPSDPPPPALQPAPQPTAPRSLSPPAPTTHTFATQPLPQPTPPSMPSSLLSAPCNSTTSATGTPSAPSSPSLNQAPLDTPTLPPTTTAAAAAAAPTVTFTDYIRELCAAATAGRATNTIAPLIPATAAAAAAAAAAGPAPAAPLHPHSAPPQADPTSAAVQAPVEPSGAGQESGGSVDRPADRKAGVDRDADKDTAGSGASTAAGEDPGKMVCQVPACGRNLAALKDYHQRYRICDVHIKLPQVLKDGRLQRFCQQCGRFHDLAAFDGIRKSCRHQLLKHNARRRRRALMGGAATAPPTDGPPADGPPVDATAADAPPAGAVTQDAPPATNSHPLADMLDDCVPTPAAPTAPSAGFLCTTHPATTPQLATTHSTEPPHVNLSAAAAAAASLPPSAAVVVDGAAAPAPAPAPPAPPAPAAAALALATATAAAAATSTGPAAAATTCKAAERTAHPAPKGTAQDAGGAVAALVEAGTGVAPGTARAGAEPQLGGAAQGAEQGPEQGAGQGAEQGVEQGAGRTAEQRLRGERAALVEATGMRVEDEDAGNTRGGERGEGSRVGDAAAGGSGGIKGAAVGAQERGEVGEEDGEEDDMVLEHGEEAQPPPGRTEVSRILESLMSNPEQLTAMRLLLGVPTHPALPPLSPLPAPGSATPMVGPHHQLPAGTAAPAAPAAPSTYDMARSLVDGKSSGGLSYTSHTPVMRLSMKLFNRTPADLPGNLRGQVTSWLQGAPPAMEAYMRPGCVFLTFNMLLDSAEFEQARHTAPERLVQGLLAAGHPCWTEGVSIIQIADQIVIMADGQILQTLAITPQLLTTLQLPSITSYAPVITIPPPTTPPSPTASPPTISFTIEGYNLDLPDCQLICREAGRQLPVEILSTEAIPPSPPTPPASDVPCAPSSPSRRSHGAPTRAPATCTPQGIPGPSRPGAPPPLAADADPPSPAKVRLLVRIKGCSGSGVIFLEFARGAFLSDAKPLLVLDDASVTRELSRLPPGLINSDLLTDIGLLLQHTRALTPKPAPPTPTPATPKPAPNAPRLLAPEDLPLLARRLLLFACDEGLPHLTMMLLPLSLDPTLAPPLAIQDAISGSLPDDPLSLLHHAVRSDSLELLQALLHWGLSHSHTWRVHTGGPRGISPLHLAALKPDGGATLLALLDYCPPDAFTTARADDGVTPFHLAFQMGHFPLDRLLPLLVDPVNASIEELPAPQESAPDVPPRAPTRDTIPQAKRCRGLLPPCIRCQSGTSPLLLSVAAQCSRCSARRPTLANQAVDQCCSEEELAGANGLRPCEFCAALHLNPLFQICGHDCPTRFDLTALCQGCHSSRRIEVC